MRAHPVGGFGSKKNLAALGVGPQSCSHIGRRSARCERPAFSCRPSEAGGANVTFSRTDADIDCDGWMPFDRVKVGNPRLLPDGECGDHRGGGLYVAAGTSSVTNCTFASNYNVAVYHEGGTVSIENRTGGSGRSGAAVTIALPLAA